MHDSDKKTILARSGKRIQALGHGSAALGEPKGRQAFYFDTLTKADGFGRSDSVIDVGCGYGDLYGFLRAGQFDGEYLGIDINPQLIEEGRKRYPKADLEVRDIQAEPPGRIADWCICCQALTSATDAVPFLVHFESMLRIMWGACRKGLVFNVLSPLADFTHPVHARPPFGEVLSVVAKLTNRFTLRHDYMPYEYAIYAYRDNAVDPDKHIFTAHEDRFRDVTRRWSRGA
jgi:SAM-dependent methyltransferase